MGSPWDSVQFFRLLDTNLREVSEAKYKSLTSKIPDLFNVMSSQKAWEEFYGVGGVGDIPEFNGKLTYLPVTPGYHKKVEHKEYAAGIVAERKLIDDLQYPVLEMRAEKLMTSAHRTREKMGARPFVYGDSVAFDFMTSEEGVALFSTSHTTKNSLADTSSGFGNLGSTALSKTAIAATRLLMRKFKDDDGERIEVGDDLMLIVPDSLADKAGEVTGTPSGYNTAASDKNMDYKRYEVFPWMRLDDYDSNDWYMVWKSQMKQDLAWLDRILPETKNTADFETYQFKQAIYYRCSYVWKDWRWGYKHKVT